MQFSPDQVELITAPTIPTEVNLMHIIKTMHTGNVMLIEEIHLTDIKGNQLHIRTYFITKPKLMFHS